MPRARIQTTPIRSAFPAAPRNSQPQKPFARAATARESPAPSNLFPFRSRQESARSNPPQRRGLPFRTRAAFPPCGQSSVRIVPPSPSAVATNHFLFRASPASTSSPRVAVVLPIRIPSPNNPPRRVAKPPPRSSPYPAPKPSAPALRFPARASRAEIPVRSARATPRPAAQDQASPYSKPPAPLPPNLLPRSGISLRAPAAIRTSPPAHHRQSISFSCFSLLLYSATSSLPSTASSL